MREKTTEGERDREREGESVGAHRCETVRQPHTHTHTHTHTQWGERAGEREKRTYPPYGKIESREEREREEVVSQRGWGRCREVRFEEEARVKRKQCTRDSRSFRPWQGLERMKEVLSKEALVVVERCACRGAIRSNMHN